MRESEQSGKKLLIRADAGGTLGTGHVMRMIALAQAWHDRGGNVAFACGSCPSPLVDRMETEGFEVINLDVVMGGTDDAQRTYNAAVEYGASIVAIDGYHFCGNYQKYLKDRGFKLLCMDDYGHCADLHADLILNQNIYAEDLAYRINHEKQKLLLGPRYSLLRREFSDQLRPHNTRVTTPLHHILISFGGVDDDNTTCRVLEALEEHLDSRLEIKLLVGSGNPHADLLRKFSSISRHRISMLHNVTNMPELYAWADGFIGAGGSTCLEWMLYDLPAAIACIAHNQRLVVDALVKNQLAIEIGDSKSIDAAKLDDWIRRAGQRPEGICTVKVDAFGPQRVAAELDGTNLWFRKPHTGDMKLYHEWANDPVTRANARNQDHIPLESHLAWFNGRVASEKTFMLLCLDAEDRPVGQTRFERYDDDSWEISYSVDPNQRGRGQGYTMLGIAISIARRKGLRNIWGAVKRHNISSIRIFERLGFTASDLDDDMIVCHDPKTESRIASGLSLYKSQ